MANDRYSSGLSGLNTYTRREPKTFDWGNLVTSGIGLGESMFAKKLQKDQIADIKGDWKDQIAAARPGNITGGAVNVSYDPNINTLNVANNPQLQGMLTGLYDQTGGYANQLANLDPYELADYMYSQTAEGRNLAQDREKAQVLEIMNARGIDKSDIGNTLFGSTVQSQNLANAQERAGLLTQSQEIANAIANRQNAAISNIYGADTLSQNAIQNAIAMGVNVALPTSLESAYQDQVDAEANTGGALADILGIVANPIGGMLGKLFKA